MSGHDVFHGVLLALWGAQTVADWLQHNMAPERTPRWSIFISIWCGVWVPIGLATNVELDTLATMTVAGVVEAWIVWQWWRRRRQGRPSRVLGVIRDMGHRLTVEPVGAH